MQMIDTGKLVQSFTTLQYYDGPKGDEWKRESYPCAGVYYSNATQCYYLVAESAYGIPKALYEAIFKEVDPKPMSTDVDGIKEEIFLKTVALLSGRASEFKDL